MQCQKCNNEITGGSKFCNYCGAKQELKEKECSNPECGKRGLPLEAVYCPECGKRLEENSNMVFVQGGWFEMGSNFELNNEKPIHRVWVDDFYICKYEVTQKEWESVMGYNPSHFKGENLPVEFVSWNDIQDYLRKLNQKTGKHYRLPTEAEWEYAARGGSQGRGYKYSGSDILAEVAWYNGNASGKTHAVGTKQPNELGLYDMLGNVWEWCSDWYGEDYYNNSPERNVKGPERGEYRVLRGGSWFCFDYYCRQSIRYHCDLDSRLNLIGFRVVQD